MKADAVYTLLGSGSISASTFFFSFFPPEFFVRVFLGIILTEEQIAEKARELGSDFARKMHIMAALQLIVGCIISLIMFLL
jgi:hypothetical protein